MNNVAKLTVNTFNISENFGINVSAKSTKDFCQIFYLTKTQNLMSQEITMENQIMDPMNIINAQVMQ